MDRRAAVARMISLTGGLMIGGQFLAVTGCGPAIGPRSTPFSPVEIALLDDIADTIIPATNTPGAKAAGAGSAMAGIAMACYSDTSFQAFRAGLLLIDQAGEQRYSRPFSRCTPAQRTVLLDELDREQRAAPAPKAGEAPHYFKLMKQLAIIGYFTSEVGATQALRYAESPGTYDGNAPYHPGDRAWFNPARRLG